MSWSFKLLTVSGTVLRVHFTFFLLMIWIAAVNWNQGGPVAALNGVILVVLVFACVVLHEFGHVFAARRYGIKTPDITLLPIGGLARLERMPERPLHELIVAAAGPAVNVLIAALLVILLGTRFHPSDISLIETIGGSLAGQLLAVNIMLVVFNLIPAFPMDGGRMFRAVLSTRLDRPTATRVAARTGQFFAVVFAIVGLMGNPFLLLIGVFLFFAAEAETNFETRRSIARRYRARDAMITHFDAVAPDTSADDIAKTLLLTTQQEFPVVDGTDKLLGFVTRRRLIETIQAEKGDATAMDFMESDFTSVSEDSPFERAFTEISKSPLRLVAITAADGRFIGYINSENVAELMMLDHARSP
jgi:Zn-dependent protease